MPALPLLLCIFLLLFLFCLSSSVIIHQSLFCIIIRNFTSFSACMATATMSSSPYTATTAPCPLHKNMPKSISSPQDIPIRINITYHFLFAGFAPQRAVVAVSPRRFTLPHALPRRSALLELTRIPSLPCCCTLRARRFILRTV